jgi:hypothetical protein
MDKDRIVALKQSLVTGSFCNSCGDSLTAVIRIATVRVMQSDIQVNRTDLGLTRDNFTQDVLRKRLLSNISWSQVAPHALTRPLQQLVDDFAEDIATGAERDLEEYNLRRGLLGWTPGGRRGSSNALMYPAQRLLPSAKSIGAIGEGVAGDYLENHESLIFHIRPFNVSPDLVFRNIAGKRILVEVKSTVGQFQNPGQKAVGVATDLLDILAKTTFIRAGRYLAYIILVRIVDKLHFDLWRLSIEEV